MYKNSTNQKQFLSWCRQWRGSDGAGRQLRGWKYPFYWHFTKIHCWPSKLTAITILILPKLTAWVKWAISRVFWKGDLPWIWKHKVPEVIGARNSRCLVVKLLTKATFHNYYAQFHIALPCNTMLNNAIPYNTITCNTNLSTHALLQQLVDFSLLHNSWWHSPGRIAVHLWNSLRKNAFNWCSVENLKFHALQQESRIKCQMSAVRFRVGTTQRGGQILFNNEQNFFFKSGIDVGGHLPVP